MAQDTPLQQLRDTLRAARALVTEVSRAGHNERAIPLLNCINHAEVAVATEMRSLTLTRANERLTQLTRDIRDAMQRARGDEPAPFVPPAMADVDDWLSLSEAASVCGVAVATLSLAVKAGKLASRPSPTRKNGKDVRRGDLVGWRKPMATAAVTAVPPTAPVIVEEGAAPQSEIVLSEPMKIQRHHEVVCDVKWWQEAKLPPAIVNAWQVAA